MPQKQNEPVTPLNWADILSRGQYTGVERRVQQPLREIVIEEIRELFVAILIQVKKDIASQAQSERQGQPLSAKAQEAIAAYERNRRALAHGRP